jgi:RNA polymerase sigma factor (sigma-70 family)
MRSSALSDQELIHAYLQGNTGSFEILLKRHKDRVYGYIYMMVKDSDHTEDIFQDTFIRVIQTLQGGKYTDEGKFLPWVMRIAHNLIIDHFRRLKRMPAFETEEEDFDIFGVLRQEELNVEDMMIRSQTEQSLQTYIQRLPKEQKEVLYMRHYAEMSFAEIAEQTGVSINTALGRMRYALLNLRKMMEKSGLQLSQG